MIDLDLEWTPEQELYCTWGLALSRGRISYAQWNTIVRYWRLHGYILPAYRSINLELMDTLYRMHRTREQVFGFALLVDQIESHYTEAEQIRLLELIQGKGDSQITGMPKFVV